MELNIKILEFVVHVKLKKLETVFIKLVDYVIIFVLKKLFVPDVVPFNRSSLINKKRRYIINQCLNFTQKITNYKVDKEYMDYRDYKFCKDILVTWGITWITKLQGISNSYL